MKTNQIRTLLTKMQTIIKSAQSPTEIRHNLLIRTTKLVVEVEVVEVARLQIKLAPTKVKLTKMKKAMI